MKITGIIPSRYASTRFPAKALAMIAGKSMIQRVYEQAKKMDVLSDVVVATDHAFIYDHVVSFGGKVVMTSAQHPSGTDRCAEVAMLLHLTDNEYVINIQGDEPFISPEQIERLVTALEKTTEIATLVKTIEDTETLWNVNTPKVVLNAQHEALYFSRQTIPYLRGMATNEWLSRHTFYKHIGIYAYRVDVLKEITQLPISTLENIESLEQLRWLENGYRIKVAITPHDSQGIDTPEDLEKAERMLATQ